jgi:regulator of sirC expression with transglutaminase-like and TPR domain
MDPTERFAEAVARDDVPLDAAALLLAAHAYPALDIDAELGRLDELAGRLKAPDRDELIRVLYGEVGLRGNVDSYYEADNSFLNRVLDTGVGIPISLAVVLIEVGRRAGVPIVGVNAPGHFLVRDTSDGAILDPFERGIEVPRGAVVDGPTATTVGILARMLNNLRSIYVTTGDLASLLWVLRLRTLLPGADPEATHELTRAQARLN